MLTHLVGDPFRLTLALGPVAVYLLLVGAVNLARRPLIVGGGRDTAALALALVGLVIVGPIELFFPLSAAVRFHQHVWILWGMLLLLYVLVVVLVILAQRPRLVIYNLSPDELRPVLGELVGRLDAEGRRAGDALALPSLGVQLHVDSVRWLRNVALVSSGPHQSPQGWRRLEDALREALGPLRVGRNAGAAVLLAAGLALAVGLVLVVAADPQKVARSFWDMVLLRA